MSILMTAVPSCIIFFVIAWRAWRTYKNGLFIALLQLGMAVLSAVISYLLTRLLLNPAKVDIFDLGQLLVSRIPPSFFTINPEMEVFLAALPTALAALIAFTSIFELLRSLSNKLLYKLEKKYGLSKRFLNFVGNRVAALAVGALTAAVCLLVDLVVLNGIVGFSANMLRCAGIVTDQEVFSVTANAFDEYNRSPVKKFTDALGCRQVYHGLTTASRNGESFSVGQTLDQVSQVFLGIMPLFDTLPSAEHMPETEDLQSLPDQLLATPHAAEMIVGLVSASQEQLANSDAATILCRIMGVTREQFAAYLASLAPENAATDLRTFCNIAAILRQHDLLPRPGEMLELSQLDSQQVQAAVREEVLKNPTLAAFFGIS